MTIPDRLAGFIIALTLLYRRARYGYPFRRIPLTQGKYAIVDPEDFERLNKHKWHISKSPNTFYAVRTIRVGGKRRSVKMHREILNPPAHLFVDHINHHGLDNRKANIRPATRAQNSRNSVKIRRSSASSKYRGVYFNEETKKWRANIQFNGRYIYLGSFKEEIAAAKEYDKAAKKYHGQFASLNFPD